MLHRMTYVNVNGVFTLLSIRLSSSLVSKRRRRRNRETERKKGQKSSCPGIYSLFSTSFLYFCLIFRNVTASLISKLLIVVSVSWPRCTLWVPFLDYSMYLNFFIESLFLLNLLKWVLVFLYVDDWNFEDCGFDCWEDTLRLLLVFFATYVTANLLAICFWFSGNLVLQSHKDVWVYYKYD